MDVPKGEYAVKVDGFPWARIPPGPSVARPEATRGVEDHGKVTSSHTFLGSPRNRPFSRTPRALAELMRCFLNRAWPEDAGRNACRRARSKERCSEGSMDSTRTPFQAIIAAIRTTDAATTLTLLGASRYRRVAIIELWWRYLAWWPRYFDW